MFKVCNSLEKEIWFQIFSKSSKSPKNEEKVIKDTELISLKLLRSIL